MRGRFQTNFAKSWAVLCGCLALVGCGGVYDATVAGVVTLDSTPVPLGTVTFSPVDQGPAAYGQIESDGRYTLRTGREEGIPAGNYRVSVVANEPPKEIRTAAGGPPPPGARLTPDWYRTPNTSGLVFTVESGSNQIDLLLTSQPPTGWQAPQRRRR